MYTNKFRPLVEMFRMLYLSDEYSSSSIQLIKLNDGTSGNRKI